MLAWSLAARVSLSSLTRSSELTRAALSGLVLPRPDLVRRAYMLGPAAEIAPDTRHPTLGVTLAELWRDFAQLDHPLEPVDLGWPGGR